MRRCDRKSCEVTRTDDPPGVSGFTSFTLNGRNVDLCPDCSKKLKAWLVGITNYELPEETSA